MEKNKKDIRRKNWRIIKKNHPLMIVGAVLIIIGLIKIILSIDGDMEGVIIGWMVHTQGYLLMLMEWNCRNRDRLNALGKIDKRLDTTRVGLND